MTYADFIFFRKVKAEALTKEKSHKETMVEAQNAINSYNHKLARSPSLCSFCN
jgi:hypothetical protein